MQTADTAVHCRAQARALTLEEFLLRPRSHCSAAGPGNHAAALCTTEEQCQPSPEQEIRNLLRRGTLSLGLVRNLSQSSSSSG